MVQETAGFYTVITLSTEDGELPDDFAVTRLIQDQMDGILDEETGLQCISVTVQYRTTLDIVEER